MPLQHRVGNVENAFVDGFQGCQFVTENEATPGTFTEEREHAYVEAETDRIYMNCADTLKIDDRIDGRAGGMVTLKKSGFSDTVLWNIHEEKAAGMSDLGEGEWRHYICVEVGQIGKAVVLGAGESWSASQSLEVPLKLRTDIFQAADDDATSLESGLPFDNGGD